VLRPYVGCATTLFGEVSQADVIKLHKASGKATFLVHDDFEDNPLPELRLLPRQMKSNPLRSPARRHSIPAPPRSPNRKSQF
jgi:hypothetical protein